MSDVQEILATPQFRQTLLEIAEATNRPLAELRSEAAADLNEMAARPGHYSVTFWDRFSSWLSRAHELAYDPAEVQRLQELNRHSALVFLPNHRSYLDPLVLRAALERGGFPPNNVLGGANLKMWPMSELGRRNGIVFIRREFRDDLVYKAVLKAYLGHLIETRQNLEWYIEGGRTRTGKLRPPRYGVLGYVLDAYSAQRDTSSELRIIPTAIVYDQQHEVGAISAEEMGGTKSPENLAWLYRFARSQSRRLGRVSVRFGEPLSLSDALDLTRDDDGDLRPRLALPKVALEVMYRINGVMPITASALVTFALLDNGDRAITVDEGRRILEPLMRYVGVRRLPTTGQVGLDRHGHLRDALDQLVQEGVVTRYDGGKERVFYVGLDHQHEAAFYRNTIVHFFVNRAIAEVALLQAASLSSNNVAEATWDHARRLRDILKYEFSFPRTREFAEQIAAEVSLVYPGWAEREFSAEQVITEIRGFDLVLAHRIVGPFLEAYVILAEALAALDPSEPLDEKALVESCLGYARQLWLQKFIHSAESISRDYFRNALTLVAHEGLTEPPADTLLDSPTQATADLDPATVAEPPTPQDLDPDDLAERRRNFAAELRQLLRTVDELRRIAQSAGQPVLTERGPGGGLTEAADPVGADRG